MGSGLLLEVLSEGDLRRPEVSDSLGWKKFPMLARPMLFRFSNVRWRLILNSQALTQCWGASTVTLENPLSPQSYVAEAMTSTTTGASLDFHGAEAYMSTLSGGREVVETEPDVYRRTDITGDGYRVFKLTSLLPKAEFNAHIPKIRE
jgi:hypothetical protein